MVKIKAWIVFFRLISINLWWAHVTVTPDAKSTAVFNNGTLKGFKGFTPEGGQQHPNSGVGASLLWKNAQKNAKKNNTSDVINKIIPHRKPDVTYDVWWPIKVLSRITSRHHWIIDITININEIANINIECRWNHAVNPTAKVKAPIEAVKGQGLISTKWNGWRIIYNLSVMKLFTWKVNILFILRLYKRNISINKFTVYCLLSAILY